MAVEQPAYTGAQYEASYYKQPNETLSEYMMRLAQMRAKGVLGGGGMLDVKPTPEKEVASAVPLGEVVVNPPSSGGDGDGLPQITASAEQRYNNARYMLDNPVVAGAVRAVMPMGLGSLFMSDRQLENYVRNTQNEATGSQGFFDYLFGRDGDVVLGDRGTGTGSLVGDTAGVVEQLFSDKYAGQPFDPSRYTSENIYGAQVFPQPAGLPPLFNQPVVPMVPVDPIPVYSGDTVTSSGDYIRGSDFYSSDTASSNRDTVAGGDYVSAGGGNASRGFMSGGW